MRLLISLLLIISITIFSWSSCAKSSEIKVNAVYYQSSTANMLIVKPLFSQQRNNEFVLTSNQAAHKAHNFFEMAIVFNEKLQQFIAFFSDLTDKVKALTDDELASQNTHSTAHEKLTDRNCNSKN